MAFDFLRASGFDTIRNYNASWLPPPFANWTPSGWSTDFQTCDIDPTHSINYFWEPLRSFICPTRLRGSTHFSESFDKSPNLGVLSWTDLGGAHIQRIIDPDPAVDGSALDLQTGGKTGAIAGVQRTIYPIPASFGLMMMYKLNNVGTDAKDGLEVLVQNDAGVTLWLRLRDKLIEAFVDGKWQTLYPWGGNWFMEAWFEVTDRNDGTHRVGCYLGTKFCGAVVGKMPRNAVSANNMLVVQQKSGSDNYRQSQIAQMTIGSSQLPDPMTIVSPLVAVTTPAKTGYLKIMVEDVTQNIVAGTNLRAYVGGINQWVEVTLTEYAQWGQGEVDNTVPIRVFAGQATLMPGTTDLRWCIQSFNGALPAVQGVTFFWDY